MGSHSHTNQPHVAVCPFAGIGHLTPSLRLAATLSASGCRVTVLAIRPTVSTAESHQLTTFFSTHPHIHCLDFHSPPCDPSNSTVDDPFLLQYDAVSRSAHLLTHRLSALSPPLSAVFSDFLLAAGLNGALSDLGVPNFNVSTTSARFFSLLAHSDVLSSGIGGAIHGGAVQIPGVAPISEQSIPPPFFNPAHMFTQLAITNARWFHCATAIIVNSFDFFEQETIAALQNGEILANELPPFLPIGPLEPLQSSEAQYPPWLDEQEAESVVYVSFGSRTSMKLEQIREVGKGLEKSKFPFLWVIKTSEVDKEETEEIRDILGDSFLERTKKQGLVFKEWVNQEQILAHPAVGGFVSHCGWNSVMEATRHGMPVVAWPQHGDQKVNAEVVEEAGLGVWESGWGWGGEKVVTGDEIAEKIGEIMSNMDIRSSAKKVGEEAKKAWEIDGSSKKMLNKIFEMCREQKK